ncbi:MAG TPA: hypothetical protein VNO26_03525, partial [Candidatus Limnocylindria bacterium]|nr:hypothetical protein [Candidatus Limnocylindria bacterium]
MPARRPLLLAGLVLAGAVGLLALIGARIPQAAILLELERAVGHPIEVDQARVRLVPQPALELLDVRAPDAGVLAGCLARFEARRVRLRLAVAPLLRGRAVVSRMDLDGPLLRLV